MQKQLTYTKITLLLFIIICLGAFLRMYGLNKQSIWYDEAVSIRIASFDAGKIFSGEAKDLGNPPFYTLILHYWIKLFGNTEAAVRSLSAVFGAIAIYFIFKISLLIFDTRTSLLTAFIAAISPLQVYFSQEARGYSLVTLLCLLSMYFYVKFLKFNKNSSLTAYTITAFLSIYSHYFAFFVLLAQNIYILFYRRKHKTLILKWIFCQFIILFLFLLFWAPSLAAQLGTKGNLVRASTTWYKHVLFSPVFFNVGTTLIWKESSAYALLLFAPLIFLISGLPFLSGVLQIKNYKEIALLLLWIFLPIILPAIISLLFFPIYSSRYGLLATPAYYLLLSKGLCSIKSLFFRLFFLSGIIILSCISLINYYTSTVKFEWRGAAHYIESHSQRGDLVLFHAEIGEVPFSYYCKADIEMIRLDNMPVMAENKIFGSRFADAPKIDFTQRINRSKRIWFVLSDNFISSVGDYYLSFFSRQKTKVEEKKYKGIKVYLYQTDSNIKKL